MRDKVHYRDCHDAGGSNRGFAWMWWHGAGTVDTWGHAHGAVPMWVPHVMIQEITFHVRDKVQHVYRDSDHDHDHAEGWHVMYVVGVTVLAPLTRVGHVCNTLARGNRSTAICFFPNGAMAICFYKQNGQRLCLFPPKLFPPPAKLFRHSFWNNVCSVSYFGLACMFACKRKRLFSSRLFQRTKKMISAIHIDLLHKTMLRPRTMRLFSP